MMLKSAAIGVCAAGAVFAAPLHAQDKARPMSEYQRATLCSGALTAETTRLLIFGVPIGRLKDEDELMAVRDLWLTRVDALMPPAAAETHMKRIVKVRDKFMAGNTPQLASMIDHCVATAPKR